MKRAFQIKYIYIIFIILFICNASAFEADFFKKLSPSLDISHQSIRAITQDKDGFIWLGTQEGLSRFDGYQLNNYHHDPDNINSLSHNIISALLTDRFGRIWIGTRGGGLNLYQAHNKSFMRFTSQHELKAITNNNINVLFEDSQGAIWIGTNKGLNKVSSVGKNQTLKVTNIAKEKLNDISIRAIIEVNKQVWIGTEDSGIYVYSLAGEFISQLVHINDNLQSIPSNIIRSLLQDYEGNIWIGSIEGGLSKYDPIAGRYQHFKSDEKNADSLATNIVTTLFEDSVHRLWVGTDKGLHLYNKKQNNFQRFTHANTNINSISSDIILNVFEDKGKMIWIGTFSGVNRWDPNVATFKQFNLESKRGLNNNMVNIFSQLDNDKILIGTYGGGVNQLSLKTLKISQPDYNAALKDKRIMSILVNGDEVWLGTRASGVLRINAKNNAVINYRHNPDDPTSLSANSITDMKVDDAGSVWVATYHGGLNKFDGKGSFTHFRQKNGLSSDHVFQILPEKDHIIWLATDGGGLNKLNTKTNKVTVYNHKLDVANSLSSDVAWTLYFDHDENLWIGTEASGLNIWSKQDRTNKIENFQHLNINHGLKTSTVYGINQDNNHDIWLSTNKGISRYSLKEASFMHFDTSHGLLDLEFNLQSLLKTNDNKLLFGSAKGFNLLDPDKLLSNQHAPDVRLTDIYSLNTKLKFNTPLSALKKVEFDYTDKLIAFEYTGLDFASPESNRFKYRLQGFDKQWIDAGKLRRATYTNLGPGKYQLQIIAANNFDVWGDPDVSLDIIIHPAPWVTWWAYLIYASVLALLLLMYSKYMTRKLITEQHQRLALKKEVFEKTQEFKNQNKELIKLNQKLESSAITDKLTGVKSRRYLDIYIEQTSRLMTQIHNNISPTQHALLPRLYLMLIKLNVEKKDDDRILINVAEFLGYKRSEDDLVVRWSDDIFAIIGSEKDNNVSLLAQQIAGEQKNIALDKCILSVGYSFFPFNRERPHELNWDQTSVIAEIALNYANSKTWLGIYQPIEYPFNFNQLISAPDLTHIKNLVTVLHD
ncbi:ligand-binding sensor domain-containing protein [Pseudoalteromonas denitrificans]|uniref:Ligand-binding sensor domain-containing protein n=1 Tax=Pseudoalteromonas denitrificans DSM 6059 TaxID=1123010 RepID=A0A1I1RCM6_9GAMM|nr:two-component regulator propeller domain-containing protein [Pseudoalteromonas denitrificans]SFD31992.1 ligand-binding sensor domain-containing protein [Pseudoalteromonas denitrificans DSM 6059]